MRRFLLLTALLCFLPLMPAQAARELPKPRFIALYFYADWCSICKGLSPVIAQARTNGALDSMKILFVTLNLTDKPSINQSVMLAQSLGVGAYVQKQGSATGYLAVLDAETKMEVKRFEGGTTPDAIQTGIRALLQ